MKSDLVDITAEILHTTYWDNGQPKAYKISDGKTECWVPASACEVVLKPGTDFWEVTMPEKLAQEKGLI